MIELICSLVPTEEIFRMNRTIFWLVAAPLFLALGVGTFAVTKSLSQHPTDIALAEKLQAQEADFQLLANMALVDSQLHILGTSFAGIKVLDASSNPETVYLHEHEVWPRSEAALNFTPRRWAEYRALLKKLNLRDLSRVERELPQAVLFTASIHFEDTDNEYEQIVTEKGYVYCPSGIGYMLEDSLDNIPADKFAIYFKQLNANWYLYYEQTISKPE
jgi:hypothetical protein